MLEVASGDYGNVPELVHAVTFGKCEEFQKKYPVIKFLVAELLSKLLWKVFDKKKLNIEIKLKFSTYN